MELISSARPSVSYEAAMRLHRVAEPAPEIGSTGMSSMA